MWNLTRNDINELNYKPETHRLRNKCVVAGGKDRDFGKITGVFKMDNHQRPTVWHTDLCLML